MEKLYISADIEGVCGIADWKEIEIDEAQGAYFRKVMSREVAAAGTDGDPLAHAMETNNVAVRINGALVSEFAINTYTSRSWADVPAFMFFVL
jgi:D-amino peptidase